MSCAIEACGSASVSTVAKVIVLCTSQQTEDVCGSAARDRTFSKLLKFFYRIYILSSALI
jgi:hypothetical protein